MHGIIPLLDPSMVLFQPIIEILACPVLDVAAHCLMYCPWVGGMTVSRHPLRSMADNSESVLEKLLGCLHIPLLTEARINQVAIGINGSIEITPFPLDPHVRFIHVPRLSCVSTSLGPQLLCNEWSKPHFPLPNCLIGEHPSSLEKHLGEVSQTQLVPEPPQDDQENHIGGVFQKVERCSCPLIEGVLTS
jgi:hypothetical protein